MNNDYIVHVSGVDLANAAFLAEHTPYGKNYIYQLIKEMEEDFPDRYPKAVHRPSKKELAVIYTAFIDYSFNREALRSGKKAVPPYRASEIREILGHERKIERLSI